MESVLVKCEHSFLHNIKQPKSQTKVVAKAGTGIILILGARISLGVINVKYKIILLSLHMIMMDAISKSRVTSKKLRQSSVHINRRIEIHRSYSSSMLNWKTQYTVLSICSVAIITRKRYDAYTTECVLESPKHPYLWPESPHKHRSNKYYHYKCYNASR